jgi:hypothetical protein
MDEELKRVVCHGRYIYETDLPVKLGDRVLLPSRVHGGRPWRAIVTSLESDYVGACERIIEIIGDQT